MSELEHDYTNLFELLALGIALGQVIIYTFIKPNEVLAVLSLLLFNLTLIVVIAKNEIMQHIDSHFSEK